MRRSTTWGVFLAAAVQGVTVIPGWAQLKEHSTRYYVIHTDLDEDVVREATLRITKMAEEYARRTKAFSGKITSRLPFYLFRHAEDYHAAGGLPGSVGVFTGKKLMAVAGEQVTERTWKTIQHEGFHQFVRAVITGDIPVWVNEGMAVYFEEAVFTGDGMVSGLIPQDRLERVRRQIKEGDFKSLPEMMQLGRRSWNLQMSGQNYDQAWSMVHFLAHADGGKYRPHFDGFLRDIGRNRLDWEQAWMANFGPGTEDFEKAWRTYWTGMPDHPTKVRQAEAVVTILTNFFARAVSQDQQFENVDEFFEAARTGGLMAHKEDWLPTGLLRQALTGLEAMGTWTLQEKPRGLPQLVCRLDDGTVLTGTFKVAQSRVKNVSTKVSRPR
jgi:hypothetical protein